MLIVQDTVTVTWIVSFNQNVLIVQATVIMIVNYDQSNLYNTGHLEDFPPTL
jgi:hypothetical protein